MSKVIFAAILRLAAWYFMHFRGLTVGDIHRNFIEEGWTFQMCEGKRVYTKGENRVSFRVKYGHAGGRWE